ncbi:HMG box protein with ARID/BRIGHT DNA-binding domain isoform 2 [Tripterygium wilfordii]|uniref:HMG box protein with ARID/BRIGHT DNA-binding domain isoform 2 n=1 Tax=Tripterygium wilfordii TaxID=458696 RepID=A0A7J7E1M1_TRIWF|nr:high mobility group B protein 15-like [Tripterygium wilfordii]KAF5752487.1 HMG box protein with ARID/BRIGHT DNA-binding domain isoform 2 [Tripterygium wilfordii]
MASTSLSKQGPLPVKLPALNYIPYPQPMASYEDVVALNNLFMFTLEKLHAAMGTKFMIPIIGGKELDLHQLFVVVTSRGGIDKIIKEKRWKEVTATFNFPSTATNASFVLRKYYFSLLYHYEQIYFFKARSWTPMPTDSSQSPPIAHHPVQMTTQPSPEVQASATATYQPHINAAEFPGGQTSSANSPTTVVGVIDGKFETGYLVTVTVGAKKLKGVVYHTQQNPGWQVPRHSSVLANNGDNSNTVPRTHRRRRRKKSEIRKRDPAHPKPNRSGYNFFFAEQHARLKPLHPGKDREISRMIGELWNKLREPEKSVYQEKAIKDKERYRIEMEDYRERLRTGHVISNVVPLQQRLPGEVVDMMETYVKAEEINGGDSQTLDDESISGGNDSEDDEIVEETSLGMGVGAASSNVGSEALAEQATFDLHNREEKAVEDEHVDRNLADDMAETKKESLPSSNEE